MGILETFPKTFTSNIGWPSSDKEFLSTLAEMEISEQKEMLKKENKIQKISMDFSAKCLILRFKPKNALYAVNFFFA